MPFFIWQVLSLIKDPSIDMSIPGPTSIPPNMHLAVLVFLKALATPIVLYSENPTQLYEEIKQTIKAANPQTPKLIEKVGAGPLKKVTFLDTEISGTALQLEPTFGTR